MTKISIRLFNEREVRAAWDESTSQWFFAAVDIVAVLNEQSDYTRNRNYWKYLKNKLKKENPQLVSAANQLKLTAPDGKKRPTDCFDSAGVIELAKNFPNTKAAKFLDWFLYSDNTIDGQSKKKAYALFESGLLSTLEPGTVKCLQQIHSLQNCIDWSLVNKNAYLEAMKKSVVDSSDLKALLKVALTDKINDREMFMKGIDYSYYYEEDSVEVSEAEKL